VFIRFFEPREGRDISHFTKNKNFIWHGDVAPSQLTEIIESCPSHHTAESESFAISFESGHWQD